MKKIILPVLVGLFCVTSGFSQVNNLTDLLTLSELSVYGLTEELQYAWKISKPVEVIENGEAISRITFIRSEDKQTVQRITYLDLKTSARYETTSFICNDEILLHRILKNLEYKGFEILNKENNVTLYDDGNIHLTVQVGSTDDVVLAKGYYLIVVN